MSCERVFSPQKLARFSQTKWWPKLKVVSFGRFGFVYNGVDNYANLFSKKPRMFNLKKRMETSTQKYPVSGAGFFQLTGKSGIRYTPIYDNSCHVDGPWAFKVRVSIVARSKYEAFIFHLSVARDMSSK